MNVARLLWSVLGKSSGMAVLEILQATSGDPDLAAAVIPKQERIERSAATAISEAFGGDEKTTLAVMRLMIWSARGLAIAEKFFPHRHASDDAIELLSNMLRVLCPSNDLTDLRDVIEDIDFTASD